MRSTIIAGTFVMATLSAPLLAKAELPVATGPAVACIPLRSIRNTTVVDDKTIDFHTGGRKVYRNTLPMRCPMLGYQRAFSYATSIAQLCSFDTVTVIVQGNPGLQGASCGLGKFTPMAPPAQH